MKVIHLISGGDTGGAKTHIHYLLSGLCKNMEATLVCFMEGDFSEAARQLGIPTVVIEGSILKTVFKLKRMIITGGYDIIHSHGARGNFLASLLRALCGIPMVTTIHSDPKLDYMGRPAAGAIYGTINQISIRLADYLIGVSDSMRDSLIEKGFQANRVFSIYNGVDFSCEPQNDDKLGYLRSFGLSVDEDSVVVGIAARLNPVKDVPTLINGFALAKESCGNLRLAIAGDGAELRVLKDLAEKLGLGQTICFTGWLTDVDSFYSALDINVLCSLSETFPYAITEGARARLATVSTPVGGVSRLVKDNETGLLFPVGDAAALAEKLVRLGKDPSLRKRLGDEIYSRTKSGFSVEATVKRQIDIYSEILRNQKRKRSHRRRGVLICGAYGHGNAGDEAILEAIVLQLRILDPDMPLYVLSRRPAETRKQYDVNALHTFNLPGFLNVMRKTKVYLNGGGSLIQDVTSRRSLWYYLFTLMAAKILGNGVIMYGCGIGPVKYSGDRRLVRRILNKYVDTITLRESYSLGELREYGVTRPDVLLSSDPALTLPAADTLEVDAAMEKAGLDPEGEYLCFCLRRWPGFIEKAPTFAKAADYAYEKYGLVPVFLSINHLKDGDAADVVCKHLSTPRHILREPMRSGLTIGVLSRMTAAVSMRLHGLVFAAGHGVPLIGVAYDPKVEAFLSYAGQGLCLSFDELCEEEICRLIDQAVELSERQDELAEDASSLRDREYRNIEALRRLLEV